MFIMMLVYILFTYFFFWGGGGTMSCLYCSWVALLRTLSFFYGAYLLKIMGRA
jgi:hypothetical protein